MSAYLSIFPKLHSGLALPMESGNFIGRRAWHRRCFLTMSAATVATTAATVTTTTAAATATRAAATSHLDGESEIDARRLIHIWGIDDRWRRIDAIPLGSTLAHCLRVVH